MKFKYSGIIGVVVGAVVATISAVYSHRSAQAAVEVRPALANVGFIDAALSGHMMDWLYYTNPIVGIMLTFVLTIPIVAVIVALALAD